MLGRLPYMRRKVRNTREASHIAATIEAIMMIMLTANSHAGSAPMLSFITAVMVLVSTLVADLLCAWADPRVTYE
mgnify:CR=1 FL=1